MSDKVHRPKQGCFGNIIGGMLVFFMVIGAGVVAAWILSNFEPLRSLLQPMVCGI